MAQADPVPVLYWPGHFFDNTEAALLELEACPDKAGLDESWKHFNAARKSSREWSAWKDLDHTRFWRCFLGSEEVYIIDRYLLARKLDDQIASMIKLAFARGQSYPRRIYIFCDCTKEGNPPAKLATELQAKGVVDCNVEIRDIHNEPIHDRLALCGDDLWICGASTGGMHGKLHILCGPWRKEAVAFRKLCHDLLALPTA